MTEVLQAGGQTVVDDEAEHRPVEADLLYGYAIFLLGSQQPAGAEEEADKLRKNGRQRRAVNICLEYAYKDDVENNVQHGGYYKVVERVFAVAHGLHDAAAGVIHDKAKTARKVDAHIERRLIEYVIRGAHPAEYRRSEAHADDCQQYARNDVEGDVCVYCKLHLVVLARAVVARYRNARARGDAGEKADQQEHERTRGADGGECVVAEHVADYQRISRVVQLLEEVAYEERHRETHKLPRDGAFRHSVLYVIHCLPLT